MADFDKVAVEKLDGDQRRKNTSTGMAAMAF
jgi:hypothetical protein